MRDEKQRKRARERQRDADKAIEREGEGEGEREESKNVHELLTHKLRSRRQPLLVVTTAIFRRYGVKRNL